MTQSGTHDPSFRFIRPSSLRFAQSRFIRRSRADARAGSSRPEIRMADLEIVKDDPGIQVGEID